MALLREDKTGKPDFTYIGEMYPTFARVMKRFQEGAIKYDRLNWRFCEDDQTYRESAVRHLMQFLHGQRDEDHAVAAIINLLILVDLEEERKKNDTGINSVPEVEEGLDSSCFLCEPNQGHNTKP